MYSNDKINEYLKNDINKNDNIDNNLYEIHCDKYKKISQVSKEMLDKLKEKFDNINLIYNNSLDILNSYEENIWLNSIINIPEMSDLIEPNDEIILSNLNLIELKIDYNISSLIFYFKDNNYFENKSIKISYHYKEYNINNIDKITSDEILWKKNMNPFYCNLDYIELINVKTKQKVKKLKNYDTYSFFIFFCNIEYDNIVKNWNNEKYSIVNSEYSDKTFNFNKIQMIKDSEELYLSSLKFFFNFKNKILPNLIALFLNIELSFMDNKKYEKNSIEISDNFEDSEENFDYELEKDYSPYKIKKIVYNKNLHNSIL